MPENRDPIECKSCGTVNAWNSETCRSCSELLSRTVPPAEDTDSFADIDESATPDVALEKEGTDADPDPLSSGQKRSFIEGSAPTTGERRWNIFWIVLGIAIHLVVINVGTFSIIKLFIEPNPELKTRLEQAREATRSSDVAGPELLEDTTDEIRSKMNTVLVLFILLIGLTPLLAGAAIGYHTGRILEVAASMGLSAVLIPLLDNAVAFAVIWGPVNAGIGALGAYLAIRYLGRPRRGGTMGSTGTAREG